MVMMVTLAAMAMAMAMSGMCWVEAPPLPLTRRWMLPLSHTR